MAAYIIASFLPLIVLCPVQSLSCHLVLALSTTSPLNMSPPRKKRKRTKKQASPKKHTPAKKQPKTPDQQQKHDAKDETQDLRTGDGKDGKQEDRHGQHTQHPVTLSDLQRTMDPLIAAQVWNAYHSPIGRLPEELLLEILHWLGEDIVALHCLRWASRTLRRLIYSHDIWSYLKLPAWKRTYDNLDAGDFWIFADERLRRQLQQHIHKDRMCEACLLHCDMSEGGDDIGVRLLQTSPDSCRFTDSGAYLWGLPLYCHGCGADHDVRQFSEAEKQVEKAERQCLGRQGAVQLCEHVHIPWATIEAHISHWRQRKPGDWQTCLDNFDIECNDPSHGTGCADKGYLPWPRATLESTGDRRVVLKMEWQAHSGPGSLTLTHGGRAPVSELRSFFAKNRQGAANIFLPSYPANPLPEMACFDPSKCSCLDYGAGVKQKDDEDKKATDTSGIPTYFQGFPGGKECSHSYYRRLDYGYDWERVYMRRYWLSDTAASLCLVACYEREVVVCLESDRRNINPAHEWLHAMDPDTYERQNAGHQLPLCRDQGCMNYYRRPRTTRW
jgi:hypothetical protein